MPAIVTRQSTVKLSTGPDWQWESWDGVVTLNLARHTVSAAENDVVLKPDILAAIAQQAAGKLYKATGFADLAGMVATVMATVNMGTLAQSVQIESMNAVVDVTEGTFAMTVGIPSMMIPPGGPPVPDPLTVKNGTWKIDQLQQNTVTAE